MRRTPSVRPGSSYSIRVSYDSRVHAFIYDGWVQLSQPTPTPTVSSSLSGCLQTHAMPSLSSLPSCTHFAHRCGHAPVFHYQYISLFLGHTPHRVRENIPSYQYCYAFAKNRYTWSLWCQKQVHSRVKPTTNHTPGALRLAKNTSYLSLAWKRQVQLVFAYLLNSLAFNCFWRFFWANQRRYISLPLHLLPTRTPPLLPSLVFVVSTPPLPHHHIITRRPATPIHIYIAPWMDTGDRSSEAPRTEAGSIFRPPRSVLPLRPSGSSRMFEASQLKMTVAARSTLSPAAPRGEKGKKKQSRVPLLSPKMSADGNLTRPSSVEAVCQGIWRCHDETSPIPG